MQVDLLTNLNDPFPEKIVRERLTESSAFYGEGLLSFVWGYGALGFSIGGGCGRLFGDGSDCRFSLFFVYFSFYHFMQEQELWAMTDGWRVFCLPRIMTEL